MKKICITVCSIFLVSLTLNAKKITILRKGSKDGIHYDRVSETHTLLTDKLSCLSPGNIECGWAEIPVIGGVSSSTIESWVSEEIKKGNLSGSTNYNGTVYVTWNLNPNADLLLIKMDDGK